MATRLQRRQPPTRDEEESYIGESDSDEEEDDEPAYHEEETGEEDEEEEDIDMQDAYLTDVNTSPASVASYNPVQNTFSKAKENTIVSASGIYGSTGINKTKTSDVYVNSQVKENDTGSTFSFTKAFTQLKTNPFASLFSAAKDVEQTTNLNIESDVKSQTAVSAHTQRSSSAVSKQPTSIYGMTDSDPPTTDNKRNAVLLPDYADDSEDDNDGNNDSGRSSQILGDGDQVTLRSESTVYEEEIGRGMGWIYEDVDKKEEKKPEAPPHFGSLQLLVKYELKKTKMTISVGKVLEVPDKYHGGSTSYQLRMCILPSKKFRWRSKMLPGPDPTFNDNWVMDVMPDEVAVSALRCRLYGCERRRRDCLLGETTIAVTNFNLKSPTPYRIAFEPRCLPKALIAAQKSLGDSDALRPTVTLGNQALADAMLVGGQASRAAAVAANGDAATVWPELLLGIAYNAVSGRLDVELEQASRLRLPGNPNKPPDSYVKLALKSNNDQEVTHSLSQVHKAEANPQYKERFVFQLASFQLQDVTLMTYVYHKKSMNRKEIIGWFGMGVNNSGQEEADHWRDILAAKGDRIARWHVLHENVP